MNAKINNNINFFIIILYINNKKNNNKYLSYNRKYINMNPKISVLIPVYGVEKYIRMCLISLFSNTIASDCEFIIVNDCTKDNSMKIIDDIIID